MIPLGLADETDNNSSDVVIDQETQQQVEIMNNGLGSEIRLLQLEKAILKNMNIGENILSFLNESDLNITDLQLILAEYALLLQEVQSSDPNTTDIVEIFVDLKHDAINLSKEFRNRLTLLVNNSHLEQIQQHTQNITCNTTLTLNETIRNRIRQYNSNQFCYLYRLLGENCSEFANQYQNDYLTMNMIKQNLTEVISQMNKVSQFNLITTIKQKKIQVKIQAEFEVQNASDGFEQRQLNRLQNRLQNVGNQSTIVHFQ